jgi:hypothetical protein
MLPILAVPCRSHQVVSGAKVCHSPVDQTPVVQFSRLGSSQTSSLCIQTIQDPLKCSSMHKFTWEVIISAPFCLYLFLIKVYMQNEKNVRSNEFA